MSNQLPLFQRKTYKGIIPSIAIEIKAPAGEMTILRTLPAYYTYLQEGGFSKYTPDDFTGDVKSLGCTLKRNRFKLLRPRISRRG